MSVDFKFMSFSNLRGFAKCRLKPYRRRPTTEWTAHTSKLSELASKKTETSRNIHYLNDAVVKGSAATPKLSKVRPWECLAGSGDFSDQPAPLV